PAHALGGVSQPTDAGQSDAAGRLWPAGRAAYQLVDLRLAEFADPGLRCQSDWHRRRLCVAPAMRAASRSRTTPDAVMASAVAGAGIQSRGLPYSARNTLSRTAADGNLRRTRANRRLVDGAPVATP